MDEAKKRLATKPTRTEIRVAADAQGRPQIALPCTDVEGWMGLASESFGTVSPAFVEAEVVRLMERFNAPTMVFP